MAFGAGKFLFAIGFRYSKGEGFAHGIAPMLEEEFLFLSEDDWRATEDGAERGGHLQGHEQEDGAPDKERAFLGAAGAEDDRF